ncbi:MAG TPA: SAM-dependent methyltransferase, partial [Ferruginibacter sp.]|nr:SAM-dependent methyltransferase [Ferruginibacter sp.]
MPTIYLVPSTIADQATETIPPYILDAIRQCQVIFAENERTARRFLKSLDKNIEIGDFEWYEIHKAEKEQSAHFRQKVKEEKNIAVISEAGCPGVADPGQALVAIAQEMNCHIKPLVGPSSILLALMA